MYYKSENRIHYDEVDKTFDFYIKDREIIEKLMETIENMAHDAISVNDYQKTLELIALLIDGEEALGKFDQPKFEPTYPKTSTGLLEDE